jgi:hypothetical protein
MDPVLQRLVDERDIVELASRYCWALDTLDRDKLATVFTPDATAVLVSAPLTGFDEIWQRIHRALSSLDGSQHVVGSHIVEVDGDHGTHRCYLIAQHRRDDAEGGSLYVVAGRYEDEVVRTSEGWRIKHRTLTVMWTDGNPAVPVRQG